MYQFPTERGEIPPAIKDGPSPSDSVKSFSGIRNAVLAPSGPRYGRPSDHYGPPTVLFSEPLAFLKYNLDHLELFTPDHTIMEDAYDLVAGSANFYDAEPSREVFLKLVLPKLLRGQNEWQRETSDKKAKSDGAWLEGHLVYLIVELKNEQGLGGDPFLQGLVTYGKIIAQKGVLSCIVPHLIIARPLSHIYSMLHTSSGLTFLPFCSPSQGTVSSYQLLFSLTPCTLKSCFQLRSISDPMAQITSSRLHGCSWQ